MNQATVMNSKVTLKNSTMSAIKKHLKFLVGQDTCNPPRKIKYSDPLFIELESFFKASGFTVTIADFADGHVVFYALRGTPNVLFNVHLDTVPVSEGWQHSPFELTDVDDRFYGRGVCDIKGGAACLMALAEVSDNDMAVLFTTDEEGANNCCVSEFLNGYDISIFEQVVVAEPTQCLAVLEHRGYVSVHGDFTGLSGHSSSINALAGNAIHQANIWLNNAMAFAVSKQSATNPTGICFNLGYIKGGEKNNMIAEQCQLGFSVRVPAGQSSADAFESLIHLAGDSGDWHCSMLAPALPEDLSVKQEAAIFCQKHDLTISSPVDFWTEAALFSQAGLPALVLGPGNIEQAHTIDEWVAKDQLLKCYEIYREVLS